MFFCHRLILVGCFWLLLINCYFYDLMENGSAQESSLLSKWIQHEFHVLQWNSYQFEVLCSVAWCMQPLARSRFTRTQKFQLQTLLRCNETVTATTLFSHYLRNLFRDAHKTRKYFYFLLHRVFFFHRLFFCLVNKHQFYRLVTFHFNRCTKSFMWTIITKVISNAFTIKIYKTRRRREKKTSLGRQQISRIMISTLICLVWCAIQSYKTYDTHKFNSLDFDACKHFNTALHTKIRPPIFSKRTYIFIIVYSICSNTKRLRISDINLTGL